MEDPWILAALDDLRDGTARVLDLRPTPAYFGGHIPGALHLPPSVEELDPWRASGLPDAASLRTELERVQGEEGQWVVIHPLVPPGPGILAAWCRAGHALATIGEATPAEVEDLVAVDGARRVDAAAPPDFGTLGRLSTVVVEGASLPVRALVASLLKARGIPEVLVLVD
jgi:rhodanese-related sulfurtransferase